MNKQEIHSKFDIDISKTWEIFYNLIERGIEHVEILLAFNQILQPTHDNIHINILNKLNKYADFWKSIEDSLLKSLFLDFRIIFGNQNDNVNFKNFINFCRKQVYQFSLEEIKKRKQKSLKNTELENYFRNLKELNKEDFNDYSKKIKPFENKIEKITNKFINRYFAHMEYKSLDEFSENFYSFFKEEANLLDIREILYIAKYCNDDIKFMYDNGKKYRKDYIPENDTKVQKSLKEIVSNIQIENIAQFIKNSPNLDDVDLNRDKGIGMKNINL